MREERRLVGIKGGKGNSQRTISKPSEKPNSRKKVFTFSVRPSRAVPEHQLSEYMTPATDQQGHSVRVSTSLPPPMKREIDIILTKRQWPFDTPGDLFRWCVRRGLQELAKKAKDGEVVQSHLISESWCSMAAEMMQMDQYNNMLANIKTSIGKMVRDHHFVAAYRVFQQVERNVDQIDDTYWHRKFKKEIIKGYQWLKFQTEKEERMDQEEEKDA